jgi:predicted amidohydrolase
LKNIFIIRNDIHAIDQSSFRGSKSDTHVLGGQYQKHHSRHRGGKKQQVSLLCLPELCITGYGCEDYFFAPDMVEQAQKCLLEIVQETAGIIVAVGLPVRHNGSIYNAACLISNKQISRFLLQTEPG